MIKEINLKDRTIKYNLLYKKVKNINLRIKSDGTVNVSANKNVPQKIIDDFMNSKADFIFRALDKYASIKALPQTQYFSENEVCDIILAICEKLYPHFMKSGIKRPIVKFRRLDQYSKNRRNSAVLVFAYTFFTRFFAFYPFSLYKIVIYLKSLSYTSFPVRSLFIIPF